jgi:hypothetical protein
MTQRRDPWLITRLFDLSFSRFVALSLVRVLYAVLMVVGLAGLGFLITYLFLLGNRDTTLVAVVLLLIAPLIYLVYLLILRLLCEAFIVVFALAERLDEIRDALAERDKQQAPAAGPGGQP